MWSTTAISPSCLPSYETDAVSGSQTQKNLLLDWFGCQFRWFLTLPHRAIQQSHGTLPLDPSKKMPPRPFWRLGERFQC
jgi:hypothetical protein